MSKQEFQDIENDLEGFWTGEGTIYCRPKHVNLCDNGADKTKPSALIVCELIEPCDELVADKEPVECAPGALIGVWYKPGMRPVLQCAGVVTRIVRDPEKDKKLEGRPKPMTGYRVGTAGGMRGSELQVLEDHRKQSAGSPTPFDAPKRRAEMGAEIDESEVPF